MGKCKVPIIGSGGKAEGLNVWKKRLSKYTLQESTFAGNMTIEFGNTNMGGENIYYSNSYIINDNGTFSLVNPQLLNMTYTEFETKAPVLLGKYFVVAGYSASYSPTTQILYFAPNTVLSKKMVNYYWNMYGNPTKRLALVGGMEDICFVVNDDPNTYPNGAIHTDGFYYELLGHIDSTNVMSLSDNAVATVQQDYRDQIETEVSNANA